MKKMKKLKSSGCMLVNVGKAVLILMLLIPAVWMVVGMALWAVVAE